MKSLTSLFNPRMEQRVLALLVVVIALGGAGILYAQIMHRNALTEQMSEIDARLENYRGAAVQLKHAQDELRNAQEELRFLEKSVSEKTFIPTLLKQLEEAARRHQLQVQSVRLQNPPAPTTAAATPDGEKTEQKEYEEQPIEISVSGRYTNIMQFLDGLSRFPKIVAVDRVQLRPKPRDYRYDPVQLDFTISVTAFIFRNQGGAR